MSGAGDVLNEMPIEDCGRLLTLAFAGLQEMCGHSSGCDHYFLPVRALVQALSLGLTNWWSSGKMQRPSSPPSARANRLRRP